MYLLYVASLGGCLPQLGVVSEVVCKPSQATRLGVVVASWATHLGVVVASWATRLGVVVASQATRLCVIVTGWPTCLRVFVVAGPLVHIYVAKFGSNKM